jgi:serine/threonine-protein kinase
MIKEDLSGTILGKYVIRGVIGIGGMGTVYRAIDTTVGRTVALKVLSARLSTDRESMARFMREARSP